MDNDNTLPQDPQQPHDNPIIPPQPIIPPNTGSGTSHVAVAIPVPPRPISTIAAEKSPFDDADTMSARGSTPLDHGRQGGGSAHSLREHAPIRRARTIDTHGSARRSELDWIVPVEEKKGPPMTQKMSVRGRLAPTIEEAVKKQKKYEEKAKWTRWTINIAIALQLVLGALTTSLSAATSGRQTSITVSVLGALTTLVASYLARIRRLGEPELSSERCKDLDRFIREARAFELDKGETITDEFDGELIYFRRRFEELLEDGNRANGTNGANGDRKPLLPTHWPELPRST